MRSICETVEHALVEAGGDISRLDGELRRHVGVCARCAAVAEWERALARAFDASLPAYDAELERALLVRVRRWERRRRFAALLPLAAGLLLAALGTILAGGFPAGGLLAALPAASLTGWLGLAAHLGDAAAAARVLAGVMPTWTALPAAAAAVGLGLPVARAARRRLGRSRT